MEIDTDVERAEESPKPRLAAVLALLAGAAAVLAYLAAYAAPGALVSSQVMAPWPADKDPRLRWMTIAFVSMVGLFMAVGLVFRVSSARNLRAIDAMADEG